MLRSKHTNLEINVQNAHKEESKNMETLVVDGLKTKQGNDSIIKGGLSEQEERLRQKLDARRRATFHRCNWRLHVSHHEFQRRRGLRFVRHF